MISAEKASTPVSVCCALLGVSRSGYYDWERRAPSDRALTDAWLIEKIREIWAENRKVYGSPRIHADLRLKYGIRVARKRVERLMREAGISGLQRRKRGRTTISVPGVRVADDLVERRFRPERPNQLWIADLTYLRTWEGWLYLAAVQDAYSRRIVGWSMADHMRSELIVDALQMAVARRRPAPGLIHHSDQGSQYVSLAFGRRLQQAGLVASMAPSATHSTTPSPRASSPRSRRNWYTVARGRAAASSRPSCSSTSRRFTTERAGTPRSTTSRPPTTRTELSSTLVRASPLRGSHTHPLTT